MYPAYKTQDKARLVGKIAIFCGEIVFPISMFAANIYLFWQITGPQ